MSHLRRRNASGTVGACMLAVCFSPAAAADSPLDSAAMPEALVRVRIAPTAQLCDHQVVARILGAIEASPELARRRENASSDPRVAALEKLAERLEQPPEELLWRLAAGGAVVSVSPANPPEVLFAGVAADDDLPGRLVDAVRQILAEAAPQAAGAWRQESYREFECHGAGLLHLAVRENLLLAASTPAALRGAIDRLTDRESGGGESVTPGAPAPLLHVELDLATIRRRLPGLADALQFPSADPGRTALLGGWLDLLRQYERGEFCIAARDARLEISARVSGARPAGSSAAGTGYFAGFPGKNVTPDLAPAPPLDVPDAIYSASWYRDYAALWSARGDLLTADAAAMLDAGDERAATQLEVFGTHLRPSELFTQFGPRFRVVVAAQDEPPYDVEVLDPLPAAALAVELRDEQRVREMSAPILRTLHLIMGGEQRIITSEHDHAGAKLVTLSLSEDPAEQQRGSSARYNFRVSYAFARGHFVIGTTPQVVRDVLDAIDRGRDVPPGGQPGETERQQLDLARLAEAVQALRAGLTRGLVLNSGWESDVAQRELDVWTSLLSDLGSADAAAGVDADGFHYRVTIGRQGDSP